MVPLSALCLCRRPRYDNVVSPEAVSCETRVKPDRLLCALPGVGDLKPLRACPGLCDLDSTRLDSTRPDRAGRLVWREGRRLILVVVGKRDAWCRGHGSWG